MRRLLLLVLFAGCGRIDVDDLSDSTKPNKVKFCTELAQMNGAGIYDNDVFLRCMHGSAEQPGSVSETMLEEICPPGR